MSGRIINWIGAATPTRFPEIGYRKECAVWRFVDMSTDSAVGPQYQTKAEMLADLQRFAEVFGAAPAPAPARDPVIYRELAPLEDGFVPAVKRVYTYTGPAAIGLENCNMPIELIAAHPSVPGLYRATAIFAFNVCHCPDYVRLEHCTPADK